jgi:phosphatidate phosphatase APP1
MSGSALQASASGAEQTQSLRRRQRVLAALMRALARIELWFDKLTWGLRRRFGRLGPLQIVTYRSYGTRERLVVRGRVLEASVLERSLPDDSRLRSVRRMLRRFNSDEVPDVSVRASLGESTSLGVTDDEGYFDLPLAPSTATGETQTWHSAEVEVTACPVPGLKPARATAELRVLGSSAELGVISDIDDTILQTHVTQKLKMIWVTLSGSAFTRMPFEGTSELYRALEAGASGHAENPVFYVSKSPWNLYDFLVDFMDFHQLPRGPLLLRDIGLHEATPLDHKSAAVRKLFDVYPELPFVLIGDSGERDPDIYLETAALYPGRIRAIYIRDLGDKRTTEAHKQKLSAEAKRLGVELLWMAHAQVALEHSRKLGLVR